jgi:hypothetical protein
MDSVNLTTKPEQYMTVFLNRNVITVRPHIGRDKINYMAQWTILN